MPFVYFSENENLTPTVSSFWKSIVPKYRRQILTFPKNAKFFIDTAITQAYQTYENYDFELHFNTWKEIFANRKIVLVSGEGILNKLRFHLLRDAGCIVENVYAPSMNAFSKLAETVNKVLAYPPEEYTVCIILGPAAKPMVCDLAQRSYIACDIGHLLKDYDAWMRKIERSDKNISNFFAPD